MATAVAISEPIKEVKRLRDLKTSVRDQIMIDPKILVVDDGFNPRNYDLPENRAHLDELKKSIRENGVLVPLLIRFDAERKAAVVLDGECRLRSVLELIAEGVEILTVPTIQVPGGNEQDRLLTAITANTGKPLSKWELGTAFQKLYKFGWDEDRIVTKTGYTKSFVMQAMELADAPEEVKRLLSAQAVTPSLALAELRANGAAAVQNLQARAQAAHSIGQKTAKREKSSAKPKKNRTDPAFIKALCSLLEDVSAEDMNEEFNEWVSVSRVKLIALTQFIVPDDCSGITVPDSTTEEAQF